MRSFYGETSKKWITWKNKAYKFTQHPIQWIQRALFSEAKLEAHYLPVSSVEVKNAWIQTSVCPVCAGSVHTGITVSLLKKQDGRGWTGFVWFRIADFYEDGNGPSNFIKFWNFNVSLSVFRVTQNYKWLYINLYITFTTCFGR